ncbi:TldD/PmbA family protein [Corallococcus sp. M34]|nr:TldD/PmbA family protein [Citreicoccus inhibens]
MPVCEAQDLRRVLALAAEPWRRLSKGPAARASAAQGTERGDIPSGSVAPRHDASSRASSHATTAAPPGTSAEVSAPAADSHGASRNAAPRAGDVSALGASSRESSRPEEAAEAGGAASPNAREAVPAGVANRVRDDASRDAAVSLAEVSSPRGPPLLRPTDFAERAARAVREVVPAGVVVQAAVLTQVASWCALVHDGRARRLDASSREDFFVRVETARGAVVDALSSAPALLDAGLPALRARLTEAVAALNGPAGAVDPSLPVVLCPAVAAPLVAGLAWLLRGDVVAATPALARAVGRKVFPSVLTVEDDPAHSGGTRARAMDDEGHPVSLLRLVDAGRLMGFLHASVTAARLGSAPNGRGLRAPGELPSPEALNLHIVPRGDALPADYTELVARVETFTTMARPGTVSLVAAGWEVRGGERIRRLAPVELDLSVLETFRALRGVGADLTFFPTADGCGTPSLHFPPLLGR